jgi:ribonuclease P protein component
MLPRQKRLTTDEVKEVLAKGKSRRGSAVSLKWLDTESPFRCAVVVSKKLAKTAVKRNQLRRAAYLALGAASLPRRGHAILFVQSIPTDDMAKVFSTEIKKLLHV